MNSLRKTPQPQAILFAAALAMFWWFANVTAVSSIEPEIMAYGKYGPHFECGHARNLYGWPLTYMEREHVFTNTGPGPVVGNYLPCLAVNFVVAACACIATYRVFNRQFARFRLTHLLVLTFAAALLFAYFSHRHRVQDAQLRYSSRGEGYDYAQWQPFDPLRLRGFTGSQVWQWGDLLVSANLAHSDDIATLPGKKSIKVLRVLSIRCDAMPSLRDYDNLLAIDLSWLSYDQSGVDSREEPEFWPCLKVISECNTLRAINLYDAGVDDRALSEIGNMKSLVNLDLAANFDITDAGISHLGSLDTLRHLRLRGTSVTRKGVQRLQSALPKCTIEWDQG